jgi:predicted amidohydrolase YtcJ
LRVAYYVQATHRGKELPDYQDYTQLLTTGFGDDMLRFNGKGEVLIWGMHDGGCCGQIFNSDEQSRESLYQVAKWAAQNQLSIQIHATTDRSADQILSVFERVNAETPINSLRWRIAHIENASTGTLERMKRLGIAWTVQHRLYFKGDEYLRKDPTAARRAPPINTALKIGLLVAAGTDAPRVAPFNPFICLRWLLCNF